MIKQIGQPGWVVEEQPANHCLKSRGPSIHRCLRSPRTPASIVPAATDQILFMRIKKLLLLKPLQQAGLGVCPHISHHGTVQGLRTVRAGAMAQPLMQLPDRIPQPGELERT